MPDFTDDATAALLRDVLHRQAEAVPANPPTDGLARLLATAHAEAATPSPPGTRPLVLTGHGGDRSRPTTRWTPALSAAAVVMIVCTGLGLARLGMITAPSLDAMTGGTPAAAHPHPLTADPLPVYLVERQKQRWALVREFAPTTLTEPDKRLTEALRLTITGTGTDTDHTSTWKAAGVDLTAAAHLTTTRADDGLVIRLPAGLLGSAPTDSAKVPPARLAVQQLVWTATATAQDKAPVRIEGPTPGALLFGSFHLGQRVGRDQTDPRAPVWVSNLVDGQRLVPGRAIIQGDAAATEASTVTWRLLAVDGTQLADGIAPLRKQKQDEGSSQAGERGRWEVTLQLPALGRYQFQVSQAWPRSHLSPADAVTSWVDSKILLVS